MSAPFIIDVQPVAASSEYHQATYQRQSASNTQTRAQSGFGNVVGGLVEGAVGSVLVLVGIPMLILPGPGLLSIAAGGALIYDGIRRITGKKQ